MRRFALCLLACWAVWPAIAAGQDGWLTDLSKAQTQAKADKKMVLIDFNGSDWCPPCQALRKTVFSSPDFKVYAQTNLVLVDIDFPRSKAQTEELKAANKKLAEHFSVEGYPTIVVLSSEGKELKKQTGYGGQSAKAFIAELEKLRKGDKR